MFVGFFFLFRFASSFLVPASVLDCHLFLIDCMNIFNFFFGCIGSSLLRVGFL